MNANPAPLYDDDAERRLISAVLTGGTELLEEASEAGLTASDFYSVKHQLIWQAITHVSATHNLLELELVHAHLRDTNRLNDIGGLPALTDILRAWGVASSGAEIFARRVVEFSGRRQRLQQLGQWAKAIHNSATPLTEADAQFLIAIENATTTRQQFPALPIANATRAVFDTITERSQNPEKQPGLRTQFPDFDNIFSGLLPGRTYLVSGEPGMGKSLLVGQIMLNLARQGIPVAIYQMEMNQEETLLRWLSILSGIPTELLSNGHLNDDHWSRLTTAVATLAELPIYASFSTNWTSETLRIELARAKRQYGVRAFMLDHTERLCDTADDANTRSKNISRNITGLAKDLDIAGMVIHTLNKSGMTGIGGKNKSQLTGSGQWAFDADAILFVTSHQPTEAGILPKPNMRTVLVDKLRYRSPPRWSFHLQLHPDTPQFQSVVVVTQSLLDDLPEWVH